MKAQDIQSMIKDKVLVMCGGDGRESTTERELCVVTTMLTNILELLVDKEILSEHDIKDCISSARVWF